MDEAGDILGSLQSMQNVKGICKLDPQVQPYWCNFQLGLNDIGKN